MAGSVMHVPQELDVFSIPHARMKHLVDNCCTSMEETNFSQLRSLRSLVALLRGVFSEFQCHERIENILIVRKLTEKMNKSDDYFSKVCDCHKDNHMSDIIGLLAQGNNLLSEHDCCAFGARLREELDRFFSLFLPHMREEEEVFQPLLLEHFTYEELCLLKKQILSRHTLSHARCRCQQLAAVKLASDEFHYPSLGACYDCTLCSFSDVCNRDMVAGLCRDLWIEDNTRKEKNSGTKKSERTHVKLQETSYAGTIVATLPPEILVKIFSYLPVNDLLKCRRVCSLWNRLALDRSLWTYCLPTQWARGDWSNSLTVRSCEISEEIRMSDQIADAEESFEYKLNCIVIGLSQHILPVIGGSLTTLVLSGSIFVNDKMVKQLLRLSPSLQLIDFSFTDITDHAFTWLLDDPHKLNRRNKLRRLNLSGCHLITDIAINCLLEYLCCINYVNLSGCSQLTGECLCQLASSCPLLEPASLYYCDNISSGPFCHSANGCSNLQLNSTRFCCRTAS